MKRLLCDRCMNEINIAQRHIWVGRLEGEPLDLCKHCADAFDRFMGIGNAGYEQLDSELYPVNEEEKKDKQEKDEQDEQDERKTWSNKLVPDGFSDHDCESYYKCPFCGESYRSWSMTIGKVFKCKCGHDVWTN